MKRSRLFLAAFTLLLLFLWIVPGGMRALDTNRVALVIRESDQSVQTACVEFTEPEITGLEVLQRSGLDVNIDVQGLGALVCRIEQTGCATDDCWCQCKGGGDCIYWSYWHQLNGAWQYSQGGAGQYIVRDGDVDGWSWGPGAANAAYPPPEISFDDVCLSAEVVADTATPTPTEKPVVFIPATATRSAARVSSATATPLPTSGSTVTETAAPTNTAAPVSTSVPANTAAPTNTETPPPSPPASPTVAPAASPSLPEATAPGTTAESVVSDEQPPQPTATAEPSTTPQNLLAQMPAQMPAVEAAAVVAAAQPRPITRPANLERSKLIVGAAEAPGRYEIVGEAGEVPDFRAGRLVSPEEAEIAEEAPDSPFSYILFGLITVGLLILLLLSSAKKRHRYDMRAD